MNKHPRLGLAIILLVVIGTALVIARTNHSAGTSACCVSLTDPATLASLPSTNAPGILPEKRELPKLLDLGAGKCVPCKMMFPVLDELKKEYPGKLEVEFIDVWKNPDAGKQYSIEVIPTQIFYDATGKELFRHIGFFAKDDILAKWKELGMNFADKSNSGR